MTLAIAVGGSAKFLVRKRGLSRMRWLVLLVCVSCTRPQAVAPKAQPGLPPLAGAWTGTSDGGSTVDITIRPIANGSVLAETFGKPGRETMTLYHVDNGDLVATHYCGQGNQPRLRARVNGMRLLFTQADITGLDRNEAHLVEMEIVIGDNAFDRVEVYRAPDGTFERTRWHFERVGSKGVGPLGCPACGHEWGRTPLMSGMRTASEIAVVRVG